LGRAVATPTAKLTREEQQRVQKLLNAWEERICEQVQQSGDVTTEALKADAEISASATRVQQIRGEQAGLKTRQEAVDHSVELIWEQQDALLELLGGLQGGLELRLGAPSARPPGGGASRSEQRAVGLKVQLDELGKQVAALTAEATLFRAARYSEPIARVAHVLDAHSSELDSVQERISAAERRLRLLEAGSFA